MKLLKKEDLIPGTIVKVNDKKSEFDGVNNGLFCWDADQGGPMALQGNDKSVLPNTLITITAPPKSYSGSGLLVLFKVDGIQDELATWWSTMRSKVDFVSRPDGLTPNQVPSTPKKQPGTFTQNQLNRLPEMGYLLEYYDTTNNDPMFKNPTALCIMNGKCKFIHWMNGTGWNTALWSTCPTKKQIAKASKKLPTEDGYRYEWFASHAEMIAAHPELPAVYHTKAPNDL